MKKIWMFGLVIMLIFLMIPTAYAFKVSPAKIEGVEIPKGKTGVGILYLTGSVINEEIKIFPTDIMVDRRGNLSFERLEQWGYSCFDWIKLPEEKILTLSKSRIKELEFKIKAPFNAKPGQYYGCIMVEPTEFTPIKREIEGVTTVLNLKSRIAVPIIIEVPGRIPKLKGKVISAEAKITPEEIRILSTFQNEGNIIEEVRGEAQIINKENKRVYDVVTLKALNPSAADGMGKVFPECLRDFEGVVKRPLPVGDYELRVSFDFGLGIRKARARADFSVTEEIAVSQKELLTLAVVSELLEFELKPGGMVMGGLEVINFDFQSLRVAISTFPEKVSWLQVTQTELNLRANGSRKIRFRIKIPWDWEEEKFIVERSAKIVLTPERGKQIVVDVVVKEEQGDEG